MGFGCSIVNSSVIPIDVSLVTTVSCLRIANESQHEEPLVMYSPDIAAVLSNDLRVSTPVTCWLDSFDLAAKSGRRAE